MAWGLLLNRYVMGAVGIAGALVTFRLWLAHHDHETAAKVLANVNIAAEKLAYDAVKARAPSLRPGAFARLRAESCGNCGSDVPSH